MNSRNVEVVLIVHYNPAEFTNSVTPKISWIIQVVPGFSDLRKSEQDQSLLLRMWQESSGVIYKGALMTVCRFSLVLLV